MSCPDCPPGTKIKNMCKECRSKYNTEKAERFKNRLWSKRDNVKECKLPKDLYEKTHGEIAKEMNISKNRVCVIERNALSKLRKNKTMKNVKDLMFLYSPFERGF